MALLKSSFKTLLISLFGVGLSLLLSAHPHLATAQAASLSSLTGSSWAGLPVAYLPPGNAITDGQALLRYALPIDSDEIRAVQGDLEGLSQWLRSKRWGPIKRDVKKVARILDRKADKIIAAVPDGNQAAAKTLLAQMTAEIEPLLMAIDAKDKEGVWNQRGRLLEQVTTIEELMVKGFPYEVPDEYSDLPQLKGRADIEVTTSQGPVKVVVDGFSAPVTAGNFVDLVKRGFYDGLPFIRAEEFYVLQTGDPKGADEGFIDPKTKQYRALPLEILVKGDDKPVYGETLEALGRFMEDPVLPFSAFGTVAMARPEEDPNGGSSQFFFFLFEPELTPAGLNLLDGRYSVFGYVVEGKDVLRKLGQGDYVKSANVISGLENLVMP
ncbi:MAG: peptidylprolyl isomerase [Cyanobacteria bacterium P01_D01_bin.44]